MSPSKIAPRIMVVEDEYLVAHDVELSLEHLGYNVSAVVDSGEEALDRAERERPDLVLMDIVLAGMLDGIDTATLIRARHDVPVVFLTAYADKNMIDRAKQAQPYGYLVKPFDSRELGSTIEIALFKSEQDKRVVESEQRFKAMIEFTHDWETWLGPDGGLLYSSPSCAQVTGYGPQELVNRPSLMENMVHPDDWDTVKNRLRHFFQTDEIGHFEFRIVTKDGDLRWIERKCRPMYDQSGNFLGRRASHRDVTARKRGEMDRERLIGDLQRSQARIKGLSGLLTVCSNCKCIRTGNGQWQQFETYIRVRTDADFSHSVCPQCATELYPGYLKDKKTGPETKDPGPIPPNESQKKG